jgi:hypothetical protein
MIPRRIGAALVALALALMAPMTARAEIIVYELLAVPLTVTADVVTDFSMTLVNVAGPDELGCLEIDLPAEYEIYAVSAPVAPEDREWTASSDGNTVIVNAKSGGDRLEILESLTFTITARAKEAGVSTWSHHAHRNHDCSGTDQVGIPVVVTVVPPLFTPTPEPTPTPTPKPTPKPTPRPTARPTPTPHPVVVVTPAPTARPTPETTSSPTSTPSPRPATPRPSAGVVPTSGPTPSDGPAGRGVALAFTDEDGGSLGVASVDLFAGAAAFAVPVAVLGGPGLLIILWVTLQTLGALTWIPAVKRLRGEERRGA